MLSAGSPEDPALNFFSVELSWITDVYVAELLEISEPMFRQRVIACLWLQYLSFLQNSHIKQPIRVKRREARFSYIF